MKRIKHGEHGEHSEDLEKYLQTVWVYPSQRDKNALLVLRGVRRVRRG